MSKRAEDDAAGPVIAYLFTTFPKRTETFLQREVLGLRAAGVRLRLYSLWRGGEEFAGLPVKTFPLWKLLTLVVWLPWLLGCRPAVLGELVTGLGRSLPRSWLSFWENLLGLGFALTHAAHFRRERPAQLHAVWGGAPAAAAWLLSRLDGHPYSGAAHAYDLYQDGGDAWLRLKLAPARFIHTSTAMGRRTLLARGLAAERIELIRRGLNTLPALKPLRARRTPLRLLAVGRLVPKKGFFYQLDILAALRADGVPFSAHIAGDGPLRAALLRRVEELCLASEVTILGHCEPTAMAAEFAWADVLLHTGIVAPDGDRDGLPNVIPEAMSVGVLVVTSQAAATTEAITDGVTGRVAEVTAPAQWVEALRSLATDDTQAEALRRAARAWVEENYDANRNSRRLAELYARDWPAWPGVCPQAEAAGGRLV